MEKTSACTNGNCDCLHDDDKQCDYRVKTSHVCRFMCPVTGRCLHFGASKPKRSNRADAWRKQNEAAFAEYRARKGELQ